MSIRLRQLSLPVRVALVAASLACAGWLAVSRRNEALQSSGIARMSSGPAGAARAERDFRTARLLNAGSQPDLLLTGSLLTQGRDSDAQAVATAIVDKEPDNIAAWTLLGRIAERRGNEALAAYALRRVASLAGDPLP